MNLCRNLYSTRVIAVFCNILFVIIAHHSHANHLSHIIKPYLCLVLTDRYLYNVCVLLVFVREVCVRNYCACVNRMAWNMRITKMTI